MAGQARQVSFALQAVQLAVVQTAQGKNPSEMVPLVHWEQVKLLSPKLDSQLVQREFSRLQVLQRVVLQSLQRKVVWLVNCDELQATHDPLLLSPNPSAHSVQSPSAALQAWQLVQGAQVPVPLRLKVLAAQAEQMIPSGKKPALQVRQLPLAWLQVRQVELQSKQALLPLEKLEVLHWTQVVLSIPKPSWQLVQNPLVLSQVLQDESQLEQLAVPPGEKVLLTQASQAIPLIWNPAAQLLH